MACAAFSALAQTQTTAPPTNEDINKKLDLIIQRIEKLEKNTTKTKSVQTVKKSDKSQQQKPTTKANNKTNTYKNGVVNKIITRKDNIVLAGKIKDSINYNSKEILNESKTYKKPVLFETENFLRINEPNKYTFIVSLATNKMGLHREDKVASCETQTLLNDIEIFNFKGKVSYKEAASSFFEIELEPGLYTIKSKAYCGNNYHKNFDFDYKVLWRTAGEFDFYPIDKSHLLIKK